MATQLFLTDTVADTHLGTDNLNLLSSAVGWTSRALSTSRGSGVVASDNVATVTGATAGVTITKTNAVEWISPPVSADVTISGTITLNIWSAESSMTANVAINARIFVIRANATATRNANTLDTIATTARVIEVATTTRAADNFTVTPTSTAVNRGDRIRVIVFGDDVGTMATGFTFNIGYNGTSAAADGDSYVSFTENFSFDTFGTTTSYISNLTGTPANIDVFGSGGITEEQAQSFLTSSAITLGQVQLPIIKTNSPTDNLVIEIQSDSGGTPSGTAVGTVATVNAATFTSSFVTYTYSCSIALAAATTYWLVARRSGARDTSHYLSLGNPAANSVANAGRGIKSSGAWTTNVNDIQFALSELVTGSQLFLTNAQSGMTAAPALISSFTGSDESPLSEGGNWANLNSSGSPLARVSNAAAASTAATCQSYWTPANFGPDLEAYVTLTTKIATQAIGARIQGEGGAATWDGYMIEATATTTVIRQVTNTTLNLLLSVSTTWGDGDKLGMRIEGSTIQAWRQASGSGDWNLLATAVDTTYPSAGKVALKATSTAGAMDDFYVATDSSLFTQKAWTSRGAGVVSYISDTDAGWTAPLLTNEWFTPRLNAFTLTGMAQANIRALESNAAANASLRCQIARVANDGTSPTVWADWAIAPTSTDQGELTTSEVARTCNVSGNDLAISDGQRLRIRLYAEDISNAAMATAQTVTVYYAGTSAAASGDTYITLPMTVTEYATAATSLLLPNRNQVVIRR